MIDGGKCIFLWYIFGHHYLDKVDQKDGIGHLSLVICILNLCF